MFINLTVVLKAKEELVEEVKMLLQKLVENATKEEGCLQYDLHQGVDKPNVFIFHEVWKNQETLDLHNAQEYLKHFFEIVVPNLLLQKPEIIFTNKIA